MKNKHLSLEKRLDIENGLNQGVSFKQIGNTIEKDCTTVSREVRNHYQIRNSGATGRNFNNCLFRRTCPNRGKNCNIANCSEFKKEQCSLLEKPPYVCNGCKEKRFCTLTKHLYSGSYAHSEYTDILKEIRSGVFITREEIDLLNSILVPLIREQHQSIHHACISNKNMIMFSESTIYSLIDQGLLEIRNIDLPRKVRFRQRKKRHSTYKIDKKCTIGRTYEDFLEYMEEHPDTPVVQMDTVEGRQGGKVLLTIHFVNCSFMLSFLRDHNDAQSVIDVFNYLQSLLGIEKFKSFFVLILTDNGSEFSNPIEIEFDSETGEKRTQIFYCHPSSPFEKGSCEVNHELLRKIFPKGSSFDDLTQEDVNLIMSHINSYKRKKLNDETPLSMFSALYGIDTLEKLGIQSIQSNEVNLSNKLLKR